MKIAVLTLGCKANQSESSTIEEGLHARGCEIVGLEESPEYCIINTCSVTSKSDYQSRQLIRRASRAGSRVIVTGCYSELNKDKVSAMEGVEQVIDNARKDGIIEIVPHDTSCNTLCYSYHGKSRFFLKVQDGCNSSCSYCIIPRARGRSRSSPIEQVIEEIRVISESHSEVVLTGIHLGTYGYDLIPQVDLSGLLSEVLKKTSIQRIRLSSLEIGEIDENLLDLLQDRRVCDHLHIPLQSGDDKLLRLMNRRYTTDEFRLALGRIVQGNHDVAIGTDIIVGFPGETEKEFTNTLSFLESLPLSYIHVFPFSSRPGTRASQMPGSVNSVTTRGRCSSVKAIGIRKKGEYMRGQIGRTLDVVVEERLADRVYVGTSSNYLKVRVNSDYVGRKSIVSVGVAAVEDNVLVGHAITRR